MSGGTTYSVRRFHDPAAFLAHAEPWLLQRETEHNLILGIANQLAAGTMLSEKPVYLATVEAADAIAGCAFRTPPYKLGVTRMPDAAADALATDVADIYEVLPAIMGDCETAQKVAVRWAAIRNVTAVPGMKQRIYELDAVTPPLNTPRGSARPATIDDVTLAGEWIEAFSKEASIHTENAPRLAAARIKQNSLYLWHVGGECVSMAAWSGETPHGRRVGYVYTPKNHRRRGYASALVAYLSQQILDDGCKLCFLYTDLANPTSNSIYQNIGYRPVCDVMDWNLIPQSEV